MKMKLFSILFFNLVLLSSAACSDNNNSEKTDDPFFTIAEEYLQQDFEATSSSVAILVNTNLGSGVWEAKSDASWCPVSIRTSSDGRAEILLAVQASEEPDVRTATITVTSVVKNYSIKVRQLGYGPAILVKAAPTGALPAVGGAFSITITSNIEYTVQKSDDSDWITEAPATCAMTDKSYAYTAEANPNYATRTAIFTYTYTKDPEVTTTCEVVQEPKSSTIDDVQLEGDIKVTPTGGLASSSQPGSGIERSFDGDTGVETHYHSSWSNTVFPVTLEYYFDQKPDMDYLIYHTRSGNGNFGEVDIYYATESTPGYTLLGSYDFKMQNAPSRVPFAETLRKVTKVKFSVKTGYGGFASCAEMEFYQKNTDKKLDAQLLTVFKDITCTEVKPEATIEQINALPGYLARLAMTLKNNTYDAWEKEFRIQEYQPYSDVEVWAEKLMTKQYGNLDNPTGIYVEKGDSVVILVGDTYGQSIAVQCIGEENTGDYVQTAATGETRFLEEGVNKVGFSQKGMLFIMYTADLTNANAKPVKIHIPLESGYVSGFFDLKTHATNDKYQELINKATYKYFCVRGERIIFYFHRVQMQSAVPYDILSAIHLWDDIVGWEQELMGIDDVRPSQFNNHLFAISPEGSYMWASSYRIAFVYTYLNNILLYDNVMAAKDNVWGLAHEIGRIHQMAINWPGSTESSNNLFSNYILYKLGKYCSRGSELSALATARCVNKQAWWNMGSVTHQNEDTEVHMRMNWQLWNYYHHCGYKADFWQTLLKLLRENRIVESDPGAGQLKFAMMASKAANENLTGFFEMWGFFEPVDETIEQYGTWSYRVTEPMIESAKNYMAQFPKPRHAFYYLEDRKNGDVEIESYQVGDAGYYTQFKNNVKITKNITCSRSCRSFIVTDGEEAVTFELRKNGKLLYFPNFFNFTVPGSIDLDGADLYAVQADGNRIKVFYE
ncbi:MAG: M60 family metallopeptidase [Bacteroides sp.]|nr:M60 family metallopeptidase [Bacteroides sp.]